MTGAFSVAFLISLIIPTNAKTVQDIVWSTLIVVLILVTLRKKPAERTARTVPLSLGMAAVLMLIPSSIGSVSPGVSISAAFPYIAGIAIYIVISAQTHIAKPESWLKRLGMGTIALFVCMYGVWFLWPGSIHNGLIGIAGHHPASYILVFFLPILFNSYESKPTLRSLGMVILCVVSILFTASRGAYILTAVWLIWRSIQRTPIAHRTGIRMIALGMLVYTIFAFWQLTLPRPYGLTFMKRSGSDTLRLGYVRHAVSAIRHFPVFGSGPGTFILMSRRFQDNPSRYSDNAHSFPLELVSTLGIVGSLPLLSLLIYIGMLAWSNISHSKSDSISSVAQSVILLLIHSTIDSAFSFFPIWILFWVSSGYLNTVNRTHKLSNIDTPVYILSFAIIIYMCGLVLVPFFRLMNNPLAGLIIAPYDKENAYRFVQTAPRPLLQSRRDGILRWFHDDPDILYALAYSDPNPADMFSGAQFLDPKNPQYWHAEMSYFTARTDRDRIPEILCRLTAIYGTSDICTTIRTVAFRKFIGEVGFTDALNRLSGADGFAKFFYFLGINYYASSHEGDGAIRFLGLANDAAPQWSYYAIALAGAEHVWLDNDVAARQTLKRCMQKPLTRTACAALRDPSDTLPAPETLARDISSIPIILPPQ